jgi:hypothetical protein
VTIEINPDEVHLGRSLTIRFMGTPCENLIADCRQKPADLEPLLIHGPGSNPTGQPCRPSADLRIHLARGASLWIDCTGRWWKPNALRARIGSIDATTHGPWQDDLCDMPMNYLICPAGFTPDIDSSGLVVAPENLFCTQSESNNAHSESAQLEILVFEPRPGVFPDHTPTLGFASPCCLAPDRVRGDHRFRQWHHTGGRPTATCLNASTWKPEAAHRLCVQIHCCP